LAVVQQGNPPGAIPVVYFRQPKSKIDPFQVLPEPSRHDLPRPVGGRYCSVPFFGGETSSKPVHTARSLSTFFGFVRFTGEKRETLLPKFSRH